MDPTQHAVAQPGGNRLRLQELMALGCTALLAFASIRWLPWVFAPGTAPTAGTPPPSGALLGIGMTVTLCTSAAVYIGLRLKPSFPKLAIAFAIMYNALIVLVKFTLSPPSLWHRAYVVRGIDVSPIIAAEAFLLFLGYAGLFTAVYLFYRLRVQRVLERLATGPRTSGSSLTRRLVLIPAVSLFVFIGSLIFVNWLVSPSVNDPYIGDIFGSAVGVIVALALAGAIAFGSAAFHTVSDQAMLVRDATLVTSFFWIGISLLAIYHILWVVYIVTLTSIWPVRTIIPSK